MTQVFVVVFMYRLWSTNELLLWILHEGCRPQSVLGGDSFNVNLDFTQSVSKLCSMQYSPSACLGCT